MRTILAVTVALTGCAIEPLPQARVSAVQADAAADSKRVASPKTPGAVSGVFVGGFGRFQTCGAICVEGVGR